MKLRYSTGNEIVDKMHDIDITGNIVPLTWCETIHYKENKRGEKKPHINAILALSDIVYWYRPTEIRDEQSGKFLGYKKKFKGDYLQRSYRSLAERLGISKWQAQDAINHLVNLGVVKKHIKDKVYVGDKVYSNVLYLELVPEKLLELTYPPIRNDEGWCVQTCHPGKVKHTTLGQSNMLPSMFDHTTYTKNTTENTIREYNHSINESMKSKVDTYTQIIKENICYESLIKNCERGEEKIINELLGLIVEIVSTKCETIRIGKREYPYQLVKSQFMKIEYDHIKYVLHCLKDNTSKIKNIRAYLLTALYNAPNTIDSYYWAEVNHDLYGVDY